MIVTAYINLYDFNIIYLLKFNRHNSLESSMNIQHTYH